MHEILTDAFLAGELITTTAIQLSCKQLINLIQRIATTI